MMPALGDYHRMLKQLLNRGEFERSASSGAIRRAIDECYTVQSLRSWHENGRAAVLRVNNPQIEDMCENVILYLEEASEQMIQLRGTESGLQPAINALVETFRAWDTIYELFRQQPDLADGSSAIVAKKYVMMTLGMTLAVVSLVSPEYQQWWTAWLEDLENGLPDFTLETTFGGMQSNNPTSRAFNTLPSHMIPERLISGPEFQDQEGESE